MTDQQLVKQSVLFLCTGNTSRSQLAEALLREQAGDRFDVFSAGLEPGILSPFTVRVLQEIDVDTSPLYAKGVKTYLGQRSFTYLVTVCAQAEERCPTTFFGVVNRLHWGFEDPAKFEGTVDETVAKYREIRDQIDAKIKEWLATLPHFETMVQSSQSA